MSPCEKCGKEAGLHSLCEECWLEQDGEWQAYIDEIMPDEPDDDFSDNEDDPEDEYHSPE
jgi:hypothetical protein